MKTIAVETTDVRAFWSWCGGQEPLVLHIQLYRGSSSKNGVCPNLYPNPSTEHVLGELSRVLTTTTTTKKSKPPPPKCSGVGGTGSSCVGGKLALWPFCFFTS